MIGLAALGPAQPQLVEFCLLDLKTEKCHLKLHVIYKQNMLNDANINSISQSILDDSALTSQVFSMFCGGVLSQAGIIADVGGIQDISRGYI